MSAEENKICVESTIRHAFVDVDSVMSFIILGPQHSPILGALVPLVPPVRSGFPVFGPDPDFI